MNLQIKITKYLKNHNNIAKLIGLLSGILWAIDGVVLKVISDNLANYTFHHGLIITFLHDAIACVFALFVILAFGNIQSIKKAFKNKNLWILIISSIFGAPLGMSMYILAIKEIGVGQTSSISITYMVLAAMLAYIFLRHKTSKNAFFGIVLAVICIITFWVLKINHNDGHSYKGYLFAILCVVGWGLEAFLSSISMDREIDSFVSIFIRHLISSIVFIVIILPIGNSYSYFNDFNMNYSYLIILGSLFGCLSFIFYYTSINVLGVPLATGLNISYAGFATILEAIFFENSRHIAWYFYLLSFLILVSLMISLIPDDKFIFKKLSKSKSRYKKVLNVKEQKNTEKDQIENSLF